MEDKYRVYAITFEPTMVKRPGESVMFVHCGRPTSFKTFCNKFIFDHMELTIEKTNEKILTSTVVGVQKIPNQVTPAYELTGEGLLREILK